MGGWVCLGFLQFWKKCRYPPCGGVSTFLGGWVAELGRPPMSFMGRGTLCHMGMLPLCSDLFCFTLFHFSLYTVLEQIESGPVSDPVDIAQGFQIKEAYSNPAVHIFSSCYGQPAFVSSKIALCPPPPPSGYPAGGWVSQTPFRANSNSPPPPGFEPRSRLACRGAVAFVLLRCRSNRSNGGCRLYPNGPRNIR